MEETYPEGDKKWQQETAGDWAAGRARVQTLRSEESGKVKEREGEATRTPRESV